MRQLFIFSLPRSGSTLLQRVLMGHSKIASISEPWIMLPQIYSLKNEGHISEYGSLLSSYGINDLIQNLPNKKADYNESLRGFITDIYQKLATNNEVYFLDKTPRYYHIIDEINDVFPEAKFIFLFRSPEQIYSSMITTWGNNRLKPFLGSYFDLTIGFEKLSKGYKTLTNKSIAINYEELVLNPEKEIKKIMHYLELDYEPKIIEAFTKQETKGTLGDPTGIKDYIKISDKSLDKWKKVLSTYTRKKLAYNIVNNISDEAMSIQGYNKGPVLKSIKSLSLKPSFKEFRDIYDYSMNKLTRSIRLHLFFWNRYKWVRKKYLS